MTKITIFTENAPKPIGPYSQAVFGNNFVFVSGQIPIDPKTSKLVKGGIETQTFQMLDNLNNILESINLTFNDIVKTSMFLSSLINFQAFNLVYERYFNKNPPTRTTIQTGPMNGVLVEIDVVAKKS